MAMMPTIGLLGFEDKDERALVSLLGLIRPYLKRPWSVGPRDAAAIVLANAEAVDLRAQASGTARLVPCVLRPSRYPVRAMHWPFRAYEILALLNDPEVAGGDAGADATRAASESMLRWQYWPEDCLTWSSTWRRLGAALSRRPLRFTDWVQGTGAEPALVEEFLHFGLSRGFILREAAPESAALPPPPPAAPPTGSWLGGMLVRLRRHLAGER